MKTQVIVYQGELDTNDNYMMYSGDPKDVLIDKDNVSQELRSLVGKKVKITIEVSE